MFGLAHIQQPLLTPVGAGALALGLLASTLGPGGTRPAFAGDLTTTVTGPTTVFAGEMPQYIVRHSNVNAPAVVNSTLRIVVENAAALAITSQPTDQPACTIESVAIGPITHRVACLNQDLGVGGSASVTLTLTAPDRSVNMRVTATADADATVNEGAGVGVEFNNRSELMTLVKRRPDVAVSLTVSPTGTTAPRGAQLRYRVLMTNIGSGNAEGTATRVAQIGVARNFNLALDFTNVTIVGPSQGFTCELVSKSTVTCISSTLDQYSGTLAPGETLELLVDAVVGWPIPFISSATGSVAAGAVIPGDQVPTNDGASRSLTII